MPALADPAAAGSVHPCQVLVDEILTLPLIGTESEGDSPASLAGEMWSKPAESAGSSAAGSASAADGAQ